jgi:hypothetical protein
MLDGVILYRFLLSITKTYFEGDNGIIVES